MYNINNTHNDHVLFYNTQVTNYWISTDLTKIHTAGMMLACVNSFEGTHFLTTK